ncbi:MAG: CapA family protein, partial [Odoribacter sp.]|nr:CapA family protein [Odoribacter sp.]
DIVIGSHPHVVQPLEYAVDGADTTGITVYSLGNFISNQSKRYTNGGIGLQLHLTLKQGKTHYDMRYLSNYVYRPIENWVRRYYVVPEPCAATLLGQRDSTLYTLFFQDTDSIINGKCAKLDW